MWYTTLVVYHNIIKYSNTAKWKRERELSDVVQRDVVLSLFFPRAQIWSLYTRDLQSLYTNYNWLSSSNHTWKIDGFVLVDQLLKIIKVKSALYNKTICYLHRCICINWRFSLQPLVIQYRITQYKYIYIILIFLSFYFRYRSKKKINLLKSRK